MIYILRILILLFCLSGLAQAEQAVPPLQQRVTDLTATLDAQQRQALEQQLAQLEKQKGAQLAILLIPTTQPETIEQYSIRVAEAWKLGRKGVDDGVILLVAKEDRAMRIEVGYGLEGALTDATSKRIIAEVITPYFKQGDFYGGLMQGTASLIRVINGEPLPAAPAAQQSHRNPSKSSGPLDTLFFGVVIGAVIGSFLRMIFGRLPAALLVGGGIAAFGMFSGISLLLSLLAAFFCFILVLAGVSVGSFSSGGGSGGGGFSGGGGGFGGGGASGRW